MGIFSPSLLLDWFSSHGNGWVWWGLGVGTGTYLSGRIRTRQHLAQPATNPASTVDTTTEKPPLITSPALNQATVQSPENQGNTSQTAGNQAETNQQVLETPTAKNCSTRLSAREARYRRLYQETPAMMHSIDPKGCIASVNNYWLEKLGYEREAVIGQPLLSFIEPAFQDKVRNILAELKAKKLCRDQFCQFVKKNGDRMDILLSTVADCHGKTCSGHSFGVLVDITERNQAKEKLRRNEALMRAINNLPPTGIFVMDCHTNEALFINTEFYRIWQLEHLQEDVMRGQFSGEQLLTECLSNIDLNLFVSASTARDFSDGDKIVEDEVPLLDGRTLRRIYGPIKENNVTFAYLYVFEDITERKQAVHKLAQATAEAEAANQAKSEFLANMSHELRSPLHAILGFTHILKTSHPTASQKENLDIIYNSGEHLLALINDILDISKIEAGQVVVNRSEFDLYRLLDELKQMFGPQIQQKGLQLEVVRSPYLPRVLYSDRLKLRQVLINLLSNALKFTATGSITLSVESSAQAQSRASNSLPHLPSPPILKGSARENPTAQGSRCTLTFAVTDTGTGISAADQTRLFEAFTQADAGLTATEGTGLGLAISHEFVQLLGGQLTVTSQPSQGSTFAFSIPATVTDLPDTTRLTAPTAAGPSPPQTVASSDHLRLAKGQVIPKVLVADDVALNRKLLIHLLTNAGFDVQTASNGKEAIAQWQHWQPDLIWMDMRMPVMHGEEAVRRIRALEKEAGAAADAPTPMKRTCIIGLSASAFENNAAEAIACGCNDFASKPIQAAAIFDKMAQHLGIRYDAATAPATAPPQAATERLTATLVAQAPLAWQQALAQATLDLNDRAILDLAQQLPAAQHTLQAAIAACVKNMAYKQILQALQEAEAVSP